MGGLRTRPQFWLLKILFLGADNVSAPKNDFQGRLRPWPALTNPCPQNKKLKKTKNRKIKEKKIFQATNHHHKPCSVEVLFFNEICTFASPGIQTAYLMPRALFSYHHTTQSLVILQGMIFFYINSEDDLQGQLTPLMIIFRDW